MTHTIDDDTTDDERAINIVREAQEGFDRAVRVLNSSCKKLEAGPDAGEADVMKSVRQFNGAYLTTIDLREKAREAGCKRFGSGGAGTLNLDEARAEIGLRLACLRGSGHGGGVSGEPE